MGKGRRGSEDRNDVADSSAKRRKVGTEFGAPLPKCVPVPRPPSGPAPRKLDISADSGWARRAAEACAEHRDRQLENVALFLRDMYSFPEGRRWLEAFWEEPDAEELAEVEKVRSGEKLEEELWSLTQRQRTYLHTSMWIGMKRLYAKDLVHHVKDLHSEKAMTE